MEKYADKQEPSEENPDISPVHDFVNSILGALKLGSDEALPIVVRNDNETTIYSDINDLVSDQSSDLTEPEAP